MIKKCKVFTTPTCVKCGSMKQYLEGVDGIDKVIIDATSPEGMEEAKTYNVMGVPTVVFFDEDDNEVATAHDIDEVEEVLDN